ncbi:MAG: hypothetical protein KDK08_05320 [Rhizobiaceae bacterium]|nr:hypothetical protein [Rhizobiaceae bacterium]MCC0000890.1 hypothetical protein [Methylobacteriaceae bacterium]
MSQLDEQEMNRLKRFLDEIESNAKPATRGRWRMDHGHVIASRERTQEDGTIKNEVFDVACRPWDAKMCVRLPNPYMSALQDMRHVATCYPEKMLELVKFVRRLLSEQEGSQP